MLLLRVGFSCFHGQKNRIKIKSGHGSFQRIKVTEAKSLEYFTLGRKDKLQHGGFHLEQTFFLSKMS